MAATKKLEDLSLEEYQAAQADDWGQYVAAEPIYIGGALAFAPGHAVPASHLKNNLVAKTQVTAVAKDA